MVKLGHLLLMVSILINVRNLVRLLACTVWAMRCIALLCLPICRPLLVCAFGEEVQSHVLFVALT